MIIFQIVNLNIRYVTYLVRGIQILVFKKVHKYAHMCQPNDEALKLNFKKIDICGDHISDGNKIDKLKLKLLIFVSI